jgi:hypothetical protein
LPKLACVYLGTLTLKLANLEPAVLEMRLNANGGKF